MSAILDPALITDLALAAALLALGLWTIAARDTHAAIFGFMIYGLLLALAWVRAGSVDVALTVVALESGLAGLLMLGAAGRLPHEAEGAPKRTPARLGQRLVAALLSAAVAVGLIGVILTLPEPAPTLAPAAAQHLAELDVENAVTAVLMAYRAVDTLFETVVVVLALVALWSLAPEGAWANRPNWLTRSRSRSGSLQAPLPALVLLARVLPPFGIVIAVHLFWIGTSAPGGKFQAGAVLAAMWALTLIAGLTKAPAAIRRLPRLLAVLGPVVFFAIGIAGIWLAGDFLAYPEGLAKPLILVIEAGLTLSVGVMLGLILAGLPEPTAARVEEEVGQGSGPHDGAPGPR